MKLNDVLNEKKPAIIKHWFESVLETYQEEARGPLRRQAAQFTNPVGHNLGQGLEGIFDGLLTGMMPSDVATQLDAMVRIRAIQDFSPSQALAFIFELKKIVRRELGPELLQDRVIAGDITVLDAAIDDLALFAFDLYMRCKEKIYDLKAQEARSMTFRLLQKAQFIAESQE